MLKKNPWNPSTGSLLRVKLFWVVVNIVLNCNKDNPETRKKLKLFSAAIFVTYRVYFVNIDLHAMKRKN